MSSLLTAYGACLVISVLSMISCAVLVVTFLKSSRLRQNEQLTPIAWLSVSDAIWAIWAFVCYLPSVTSMEKIGDISPELCVFMGIFGNFGALSSFFWYSHITRNCIIVLAAPELPLLLDDEPPKWWAKHVYAWGGAFFFATLPQLIYPTTPSGYGPVDEDGYECWIPDGETEWMRISYYGPLTLIIVQALFLLGVVAKISFYDWYDDFNIVRVRTAFRIIVFVLVFVIVWGEALVSRTIEYFYAYERYEELFPYMEVVHIVLKGSAGLVNGLVWISSSVIRTEIDKIYESWRGRKGTLKASLLGNE